MAEVFKPLRHLLGLSNYNGSAVRFVLLCAVLFHNDLAAVKEVCEWSSLNRLANQRLSTT